MISRLKELFSISINEERNFGLDLLRALAIIFVMISHGGFLLHTDFLFAYKFFVLDGVAIFFVLSGFLIGNILHRTFTKKNFTYKKLFRFWIRRWFRTLPNYYLILFVLVFARILFNRIFDSGELVQYLYFGQNFYNSYPKFFPESWSLSVEEWFYILVPILLLFCISLLKLSYKISIILISLSIIIFTLVYKFKLFHSLDFNNPQEYLAYQMQVLCRLDGIMVGVLFSYLYKSYNKFWQKASYLLFTLSTTIILLLHTLYYFKVLSNNSLVYEVFNNTLFSILIALTIPFLINIKTKKHSFYRLITKISLISYSMYLLNLSVMQYSFLNFIDFNSFIPHPHLSSICKFFVFWILTYLCSIILYKFYEKPILNLRDNPRLLKFLNL